MTRTDFIHHAVASGFGGAIAKPGGERISKMIKDAENLADKLEKVHPFEQEPSKIKTERGWGFGVIAGRKPKTPAPAPPPPPPPRELKERRGLTPPPPPPPRRLLRKNTYDINWDKAPKEANYHTVGKHGEGMFWTKKPGLNWCNDWCDHESTESRLNLVGSAYVWRGINPDFANSLTSRK